MIPALEDLRLVPLRGLILHEAHDERRLDGLRGRIREEGVQRNPVIVAPYEGEYLVLDGAHRVHAVQEIGCALVLAQVVETPASAQSWGHLIEGLDVSDLRDLDGVEVSEDAGDGWISSISLPDGRRLDLRAREAGLEAEVRALWELQKLYPEDEVVRRVNLEGVVKPARGQVLITYRPFAVKELVEVVRCGTVLPAGITRFRVRERVLGVRFPLEKMNGDPKLRNAELREFVEDHWRQNRIRHYDEPVVLFE